MRLCEELLGRVKGRVEKMEEGREGRRERGTDGEQTDGGTDGGREGGRVGGLERALFAKALVRWLTQASSAPVLRARARAAPRTFQTPP